MTTRSAGGGLLALIICAFSAAPGAPAATGAADPAARIRTEIARFRQSLEEKPIAGEMASLSSAIDGALKASTEALDAGRLYQSLEALGRAADLIHGARFAAEKEAAV